MAYLSTPEHDRNTYLSEEKGTGLTRSWKTWSAISTSRKCIGNSAMETQKEERGTGTAWARSPGSGKRLREAWENTGSRGAPNAQTNLAGEKAKLPVEGKTVSSTSVEDQEEFCRTVLIGITLLQTNCNLLSLQPPLTCVCSQNPRALSRPLVSDLKETSWFVVRSCPWLPLKTRFSCAVPAPFGSQGSSLGLSNSPSPAGLTPALPSHRLPDSTPSHPPAHQTFAASVTSKSFMAHSIKLRLTPKIANLCH